MKYKGNKALMKCCKSCKYKKRIKCTGNPIIHKYQGFRFCIEYEANEKVIARRFKHLDHIKEEHIKEQKYMFCNPIKQTSRAYRIIEETPVIHERKKSQIDMEEIKKPGLFTKFKSVIRKLVSHIAS